jgi:transcriptional regulator with XRE-family HTH domain
MQTFGERLRQLRDHAGLTQEQLAAASGVNLWTIRGYEQGRREPGWKGAIHLARALGVQVEAFADCLSREEEEAAKARQSAKRPAKAMGVNAEEPPKKPRGRPRKM